MKQILLFLTACCFLPVHLMADDLEDAKKEINRIKKSSQYIYSEVTAPDAQGAKDMAEEILFSEINEWVTKQKKLRNSPNIVINNRKELWTSVELPRGNMIRAFLYVKKSDIIPAENTEVIENTSKIEEIKSEVNFTIQLPEEVQEITKCTRYSDMASMITDMKQQGRIAHYGRYSSLQNPKDYYLAIYNKEGEVVAVLTPGTERINVQTRQTDSEKNYKGCGAIGFKINK